MPRIARVVAVNFPRHITQRGNYRQRVFVNEGDYRFYLYHLKEYCIKYKLAVLAYCLMPNHVHFMAIPADKDSLAKTFNACHMRYAHYFNEKNKLTGHLWQGRFYSCIPDEKYLYCVMNYVENNPVRAGMVKQAWQWPWSSAREHALGEKNGILSLANAGDFSRSDSWRDYLLREEEDAVLRGIRKNTLTGRPFGDDVFIDKMEKLLGRKLKALPRGRPKQG